MLSAHSSLHLLTFASILGGVTRFSAPLKNSSVGEQLSSLGEFIGSQRKQAELSLRQLAEQAGVSNPYLSQIERGLRKPSAEVLQGLARALRISAETLYVRAGILDPVEHASSSVEMAILTDTKISERQKQVLNDIYASFLTQNTADTGTVGEPEPASARTRKASTTRPRPRKVAPGAKKTTTKSTRRA